MNPLIDDRIDHPGGERVRAALHGAAASLQLDAPGPDAARAAAHHRARRQQRMTAGIASLAVVAGGVGVASLVAREPGVELDPSSPAAVGSSSSGTTFTWVDAEQVLAAQPQIVQAPDGVLYALSTAPGVTWDDAVEDPLPQAIYRSTDGLSWEATELDPELQLSSFDVGPDGVLYAVSTTPAALQVATSADGGASWQLEDLPASAPAPVVAEGVVLSTGGQQVDVATGAAGTVATLHQQWFVMAEGLVPPEDEERSWLVPTAEGLEVNIDRTEYSEVPAPEAVAAEEALAEVEVPDAEGAPAAPAPVPTADADVPRQPEVEVIRTIPWAEVGLTGPQDLLRTEAFAAVAGGDWTAVSLPDPGSVAQVEATGGGFVAILHQPAFAGDVATPVRVARSADGVSWTLDDAPLGEATWISQVGTTADRIVVTTSAVADTEEHRETVAVVSSGDAGRTWSTTSLDQLAGDVPAGHDRFFNPGDVGALGIVATATVFDQQNGEDQETTLLYSPDGVAWDTIPATDLGADVASIGWLSIDTDRITASVHTADGSGRTVVGTPTR